MKHNKIGIARLVMHGVIILGAVGVIIGINKTVNDFSGQISQAIMGFGINTESQEYKDNQATAAKFATELEEEGLTLLKNDNYSLPLYPDKVNINVFGWSGCDKGFIYQGGGSGEGSRAGAVSFYKGLENSGLSLNQELRSAYENLPLSRSGYTEDVTQYYRLYEPGEEFYTEALMNNAKAFSDTAIIVLGRRGAEGTDLPVVQYDEKGNVDTSRKYSQISPKEEIMIKKVTDNFENVIVVMDTANPMECGFLNNPKIDSALVMYMPGNHGTNAVGSALTGNITPSGKTVDTFAYDLSTAPSYSNAGHDGVHWYGGEGRKCYQSYNEDIYIGYQWYETADEEGYFNTVDNEYGKGYNGVVQYPFGYGLSYTDFAWTMTDISIPDGGVLKADDEIKVEVSVENIGGTFGRDVVELYYTLPYTSGGIEKPSIKLGAFAKTEILQPGELQKLVLTMKVQDMASYDCYDKNNNGFMGYELEKGDYSLSLRTDVHTVKNLENASYSGGGIFNYKINSDIKYENDSATGNPVHNLFTNYENPTSGAKSTRVENAISDESKAYSIDGSDADLYFNYLTRENFEATYPIFADLIQWSKEFKNETWFVHSPKVNSSDVMPVTGSTETNLKLNDLAGVDFNDPKWDQLVSQLTVAEMKELTGHGGFGTIAIDSIGKSRAVDMDGPSGFNTVVAGSETGFSINYPCETVIASTWNFKLAYEWGKTIGTEASIAKIDGWYAPGANTHRSPLGGRNFEYFSEDGYLAGKLLSGVIIGAKEKGLYAYIKHFAANDSDTGRNGEYKWLTEQSFREIYCKPFEIAVKEGGANGMMGSVDRIGSVRSTGSSCLMTDLLRTEWGFKGSVITDYYQGGDVNDVDEGIRAGNDLMLNPNPTGFDDDTSATAVLALQKSSKNILYTYIDTKNYAATSTGLDLSTVIGTKSDINDWQWKWGVVVLDVVLGASLAAYGVLIALRFLGILGKK